MSFGSQNEFWAKAPARLGKMDSTMAQTLYARLILDFVDAGRIVSAGSVGQVDAVVGDAEAYVVSFDAHDAMLVPAGCVVIVTCSAPALHGSSLAVGAAEC